MYEFLKKDWIYKIAALLLAILLWFYVANLQNPTIEKSINVSISYSGLKEGLMIGEKPENIDVKLKGTRSALAPLTEKDIKASVDLSEAKLGEHNFPIDIVIPTGVELIRNNLGYAVELQIDAILMRQLAIEVQTENSVAPGYSSYIPEISPSRVVVRGAQQLLDSLETAQITIDLNQAKDNLVLNSPVVLIDKDGNKVSTEYLEVSPITVQVSVPVIQNIPTKTVPIKAALVGNPKDKWQVYRVVLEPETVKITGSYERLESINHVMTQPIDTTGLQNDLVTQVGLISPEGISLLYEPAVKVVVQIEEAPITKTFEGVIIDPVNKPVGSTIQIKPEVINLTVQGARQEIDALEKNLKALVDLTDKKSGTHQVEVKVELPSNFHVTKVEPSKVEVIISVNSEKEGSY
ncbi:MAG: hypothetical protein CVU87_02825 [Firmicutes bacterium HGW-Firmicutes-12]|jgi:YbbR domain-containing protein|nr:MAG: hypothetical protein CVU87_02825 [Firmicutes bacterium HGW-Firmicutes-12]